MGPGGLCITCLFISGTVLAPATAMLCVFELTIAISQGLIFTRKAYLRSGWNIVDLLVLLSSWADFVAFRTGLSFRGGSVLKVLRLARVLRPMRLISRTQSLRVMLEVRDPSRSTNHSLNRHDPPSNHKRCPPSHSISPP
jgi:hypothetical protein